MSSSEVQAVSLDGGRPLPKPASLPAKAEVPVPTEVPKIVPEGTNSDAVKVDVLGTSPQPATDVQAVSKESKELETQSVETAERIAENLRKVLSSIKSTKVSFDVSIQSEGKSSLSFQVVDTKSGEVVREFPPEIAESLSHRTELAFGKGLLLEDSI